MPETDNLRLLLGAEVACTDGVCGLVHSLVVDPRARMVTHLVVEPKQRLGLGRLVTLDRVSGDGPELQLDCDLAEFESFPHAEVTQFSAGPPDDFLPPTGGYAYFGYGGSPGPVEADVEDVLPPGEVAEHPEDTVSATDGPIGVVAGFVVDRQHHSIDELLVSEERLLFGHKVIAVPASAITSLHPGVQLNLATAEVPAH